MDIPQNSMTAAEYWEWVFQNPDMIQTYELINSILVESPSMASDILPKPRRNSWIALEIGRQLSNFVIENSLGRVFGADGGYTLFPNIVRIPDVSFVSTARMPQMEDVEAILAPDLAVEVISPSETARKVHDKTTMYLEAGTRLVWNVYPEERVIEVWTQSPDGQAQMRSVTADDQLAGGNVLPNFTLNVADIFPS
jgi:Uma2 family endonuclease